MTSPDVPRPADAEPPRIDLPWCLGLTAVLLLAVLLHGALFASAFPLTGDEVFSWYLASQSHPGRVVEMTARDVHPPLYYLCLWLWVRLFGASELALRSLSGVLSVGTVAATAWYAGRWSDARPGSRDRWVPCTAALLVALSLAQAGNAHQARMYTLMSLLAVLSAGLLLRAVRRPSPGAWAGYAAAATGLVYPHNYGLFFVAGQAAWVLADAVRAHRPGTPRLRPGPAAVAFATIALCYLPWVPVLLEQSRLVGAGYWISQTTWQSWAGVGLQFFNIPLNTLPELPSYQAVVLGLLAVALLVPWTGRRSEWQLEGIMAAHAAAVLGVGLVLGRSVVVPRYLVYLFPLCVVPLAYWLHHIPDVLLRRLTIGWVVVLVAYSALDFLQQDFPWTHRESVNAQVAETLSQEARPDEPVLVQGILDYLATRCHLQRRGLTNPCWLDDDALDDATDHHVVFSGAVSPQDRRTLAVLSRTGASRFWVVGDADEEAQACNLILLRKYDYHADNPYGSSSAVLRLYAVPVAR